MASPGKSYPDRSRDERRVPARPPGSAPNELRPVRQQGPTLSPEQVARLEELDAMDALMRDTGGSSPISQVSDYLIRRDQRY